MRNNPSSVSRLNDIYPLTSNAADSVKSLARSQELEDERVPHPQPFDLDVAARKEAKRVNWGVGLIMLVLVGYAALAFWIRA